MGLISKLFGKSKKLVDLTPDERARAEEAGLMERLYQGPMSSEAKKRFMEIVQSTETIDDCLKHGGMSTESAQMQMDCFISDYRKTYQNSA